MPGLRLPEEAWEDVEKGVDALLEEWMVEEGSTVESGQPLANATVIKTSYEVVAPASGTLQSIAVAAGETFSRDTDIGEFVADGSVASSSKPEGSEARSSGEESASDHEEDQPSTVVPFTGIRGAVARNMSSSWQNPRVAAGVRVDMSACLAKLKELREELRVEAKLTPTHLLLRAVALTLLEHPRLNGSVEEDGVHLEDHVAIGLAVSMPEGILVPVLSDVASKSLEEIVEESRSLAERGRAGKLSASELKGGTFTVSTLGTTGIDWFTPIINSPEIAILGVGAIADRPVSRGGELVAASTMDLTLVYDHRAVDGHPASLMLAALRDRIETVDLRLQE